LVVEVPRLYSIAKPNGRTEKTMVNNLERLGIYLLGAVTSILFSALSEWEREGASASWHLALFLLLALLVAAFHSLLRRGLVLLSETAGEMWDAAGSAVKEIKPKREAELERQIVERDIWSLMEAPGYRMAPEGKELARERILFVEDPSMGHLEC
jgi:hypothetical protein